MRIQLSDHFNYIKLLRYSLPSIIMTIIVSLYGIMDGLFVSNFAGKTSFAAISLILPFVFAMGSVGFIIVFDWGVVGAAVSSVIGQIIGSVVPVLYFLRRNDSLLRFVKPVFDGKVLLKTCTNGSSEMVTSLSSSVVGVLINLQLMKFAGENGIAAYGVILYVNYIFYAVFIGYATGCAPIISYHYGAENHSELKNLFRKSMVITGVASIFLTAAAIVFSGSIAKFFVGYDSVLMEISKRAFALYAVSFLICGFNIFASAFFTALNNGFISAAISFARTFLFQAFAIIVLPRFIGMDGIWLAVVVAETMALALAIFFFVRKKNQYHYA